jgi:hypothetical protein
MTLFLLLAMAASDTTALNRAKLQTGPPPVVEVVLQQELSKDLDIDSARKTTNWSVMDLSTNAVVHPVSVDAALSVNIVSLHFSPVLDQTHRYILVAQNLSFDGNPTKDPAESVIINPPIVPGPAPPTQPAPKPSARPNYTAAENRDDATFYLSGQFIVQRSVSSIFGIDLKYRPEDRWLSDSLKAGVDAEFLASNDPESDPNSGHLGFFVDYFPVKENGNRSAFLKAMKITVSPRFESDRYFQNTNAIVEMKTGWTPLKFPGSKYFSLRPAIGFELGKNMDSSAADAKGLGLSRGLVRLLVFKTFKFKGADGDQYKLSAEYTQRFLMKPEVYFKEDDAKLLQPVRYAATPRGYFDANSRAQSGGFSEPLCSINSGSFHQSTNTSISASQWA